MTTAPTSFDGKTAKVFQARVAGSPHHAYKDAYGSICLCCVGFSAHGGVALNESGLTWLRAQEGQKFVRFLNANVSFDQTVSLDDLPEKQMRQGKIGRYAFYDVEDLGGAPAFPEQNAEDCPF